MRAAKVPLKELRRVVIAASVGNIIEWYDFYIFGSLASILAVKFFERRATRWRPFSARWRSSRSAS
jgi:hypothetical protein